MADYLEIARRMAQERTSSESLDSREGPEGNASTNTPCEISEKSEKSPYGAQWPNTLRPGPPPRPVDAWLHAVCLQCHDALPVARLFFCCDACQSGYGAT